MAISGRNSEEKTVRERTLYTGLADCKIIAINPTQQELIDLTEIDLGKEITYVDNDNNRTRIDFWVETQTEDPIRTKMSLWLTHTLNVSGEGKPQWLNKYGRTSWYNDESEAPKWFKTEGARQCYRGEEVLHNFLSKFLNTVYNDNTNEYDECQIDNPKALAEEGNVTELRNILKDYKDNTVRLLFGIDENGYQNIYNKHFEKTCVSPNYKVWDKKASGTDSDYDTFKATFQQWEFLPYVPVASQIVADAEATDDAF